MNETPPVEQISIILNSPSQTNNNPDYQQHAERKGTRCEPRGGLQAAGVSAEEGSGERRGIFEPVFRCRVILTVLSIKCLMQLTTLVPTKRQARSAMPQVCLPDYSLLDSVLNSLQARASCPRHSRRGSQRRLRRSVLRPQCNVDCC